MSAPPERAIEAVLLIAFGGPTAPSQIRPFLDNATRGRQVPRERLEEVARHYEAMPGGRSPLNALTEAQAAALRARLGGRVPVYVGMRNWHPYLPDTLTAMARDGRRRALGVILSAFRCEASWERYMADVAAARASVAAAPEIVYAAPWSEHPRFVSAVADRVRTAFDGVPAAERERTPLLFTAHSIPRAMAEASPYVAEFTAAAAAVARRLGHARWLSAYQSRSGSPREPWLEPDVGETIRDLAKAGERRVVLVPIGFVVDHVEVLYDLDVEARAIAAQHGVAYHRAAAVNDHPEFVEMLAEVVEEMMDQAQGGTQPGLSRTGHPRPKSSSRHPLQ